MHAIASAVSVSPHAVGLTILWMSAALLGAGCSSSETGVPSGAGAKPTASAPAAGKLAIEIDPALTRDGITVVEKSRDTGKIVLLFGSTKTEHDSNNYSRVLFGPDGKEISHTGISVPRFARGVTFELEVIDDDLAKASRMVIQPLVK
jgi:hypothetical protein